jgi:hypothetical protein
MWEQVQNMLGQAALRTTERVAEFLPGLVGLLVVLVLAFGIAMLARVIVLRGLKRLQFDQRAEQWGLAGVADWSAVGGPSLVVARIVFWILIVAGLLASFSALDAALPEAFARRIFRYLPDVLAAALILLLGSGAARYLARSVLIGAVNLHMPWARVLSLGVKWLVLVLTWAMALEHLGIGRRILPLAFGILFGGIVLALALAVGLGSKDLVRTSLERQGKESAGPPDNLPPV